MSFSVGEAFRNVDIQSDVMARAIAYEPLGCLALRDSSTESGLTIIGFCPPTAAGTKGLPNEVTPVIDLQDIPQTEWSIDRWGKGVAPRLYTSKNGLEGLQDRPQKAGVYTVEIAYKTLLDLRGPSDKTSIGKLGRIQEHGAKIISTKRRGLEEVVEEVHQSYYPYDIVLMNQPPRAQIRRITRGVRRGDAPEELFLIRNPWRTLTKVGEYQLPNRRQRLAELLLGR